MRCTNCGTELVDGTMFCENCGEKVVVAATADSVSPVTPIQSPVTPPPAGGNYIPPEKQKKALPVKMIAIAAAAIVVVVIAIALIAGGGGGGSGQYINRTNGFYIENAGSEEYITYTGGLNTLTEGRVYYSSSNISGTAHASLIREDPDDYELTLFLFTDKKEAKVADDVDGAVIALNSDAIVYTSDSDGEVADLYIYTGGKSQKISSDYCVDSNYAISPDGKTVIYTDMLDDDEFKLNMWNGGKITVIAEEKRPLWPYAVSNGGKYIYAEKQSSNGNGTLYIFGGKEEVKLGDTDSISSIMTNIDGTQLLYSEPNRVNISVNGGEKQKIGGSGYLTRILPSQAYDTKDFKGTFYADSEGDIYRITNKYETERVARGASSIYLADDGKTLTYLKGGRICQIDGMKKDAEEVRLVSKNVSRLVAVSSDGKSIYFINDDDELMYQKGTDTAREITDDYSTTRYVSKTKSLFYVEDDELYVSVDGANGVAVKGYSGDEFLNLRSGIDGLYFVTLEDGDEARLYKTTDGKKVDLLQTYDY